jgi:hypothetical protein
LPRYASQIILVARIWFTPLYCLFAIKPELV